MADETGSPRPKYPPPKPPSPTANPPQGGYPPQVGYPQQPSNGPGAVRAPAQPPAYWPLSIISFICSFLFGGIAMYFSSQVGSRWRAGNTTGAEKASKMALIWGIVGIAVGLIVFFAVIGSAESGY
jgi:4-amino-4-deoxy-L-arabinose transferase-like glycosyltransferase